jgi:hypothetical protein
MHNAKNNTWPRCTNSDVVCLTGLDVVNDVGMGSELPGGTSVVAGCSVRNRRTGTTLDGPSTSQLELLRSPLYCWSPCRLMWLESGVGGAGVLTLGTVTQVRDGQVGGISTARELNGWNERRNVTAEGTISCWPDDETGVLIPTEVERPVSIVSATPFVYVYGPSCQTELAAVCQTNEIWMRLFADWRNFTGVR